MSGEAPGLDAYLRAQEKKDLLRLITCGSVDDGKSTLIGRLLYEGKMLLDDQLDSLKAESARVGTQAGDLDLALLVDGLSAEREQGITIDIAYRFFATDKRKFIVADTPGHEQYTRNMATAASTADLAIILADVHRSSELLTQTRRHSYICSMLGIRHIVLAVNKMDLVQYDHAVFEAYVARYMAFAKELGLKQVECIPISALRGDNVVAPSSQMSWYRGIALLPYLETVEFGRETSMRPLRMPVQWVNRPNADFRGFAGTIASGTVRTSDRIKVLPSGQEATISRIVTQDADLETAVDAQAVTLVLDREIDVSRGDVICAAGSPVSIADQFAVRLLWMAAEELLPGRTYLMKAGTGTTQATVTALKHKISINTLEYNAAKTLQLNEIGLCNISLDRPIAFEPYGESRDLGSFILIDRITNQTIGMGLIDFALRRASNIHWQNLEISRAARAAQKNQKAAVIWFTGLSGSGKSTIASALEKRLYSLGRHTYVLDGDNVRHGLNRDLGFTDADRIENIRRVAEVARLMVDAGLLVIVSFISPFRNEREAARNLMGEGEFLEVFVDAPLDVCEARDPKGLYKKARRQQLMNFTGIGSLYEPPENPDAQLDTTRLSVEAAVDQLLSLLEAKGLTSA
ncbi:sulfate adenylyltransferase subunit CysN [uncultured Reyranella sp.]|uniref:sulfate adenylyltransferase subunit CysN n=1 Tax=uncultured Reyranella sp. TaxID=735512 RepID=UPI0025F8C4F0|nr:sulfate adenylyltransferase subunit CysN [uncultured Reyranella sp.]